MKIKKLAATILTALSVAAGGIGAIPVTASEDADDSIRYFDNMELEITGDEVPGEFHDETYRKNAASAKILGYDKPLFLSDKFGFSFYHYETGSDVSLKYGRDISAKGGEFLNIYFTAPSPEILADKSMDSFFEAAVLPVTRIYKTDEKLMAENIKKGRNSIGLKKDENFIFTSGDYEVTVASVYKEKSSNILISYKNSGKTPFDIKKVGEEAEKIFGPISGAENYHSFTVDNPPEKFTPLIFENTMAKDRPWETYKIRAVMTSLRTNESVEKTGEFPGAVSPSLSGLKNTMENDFVELANSVTMTPKVREYGNYKIQMEQNLNDRDKITVIIEGQEEFPGEDQ